ncbi:MAG: DUF4465 domain-containing protein [Phycisphaerales bacterium]
MKTLSTLSTAALLTLWASAAVHANTVNFEDLSLSPNSFYNGSDNAGGFASSGAYFGNSYTDWGGGFYSWDGFAYSNVNDTTTAGFGNQYAAYTGTGFGGAGNYAVAFAGSSAYINLPAGQTAQSFRVTNTTYAALSMLNGDSIAKKFGGTTGNDPDYFSVTFTGYDAANAGGSTTGFPVTFYLADYSFTDNAQDYIVSDWQLVDLTPLGSAASIALTWASSDTGNYGINTPTYVALDNLVTTPEPASIALLAIGASTLIARRRRIA